MFSFSQNKIFKILVITLGVIIVGILIREIFLSPKTTSVIEILPPISKINIDFNALQNPFLVKLSVFDKINLMFDKNSILQAYGREDPFVPYK